MRSLCLLCSLTTFTSREKRKKFLTPRCQGAKRVCPCRLIALLCALAPLREIFLNLWTNNARALFALLPPRIHRLVIGHSFDIRISSFVISPPTFYHSPSLPAESPHCLHSSDLRDSQCSRPSNPFGHSEFRKISKIIGAPELGSRARRSTRCISRTEGWSPSALLVFGGGRPRMKKGALCWWTPHPHKTQGPCQRSGIDPEPDPLNRRCESTDGGAGACVTPATRDLKDQNTGHSFHVKPVCECTQACRKHCGLCRTGDFTGRFVVANCQTYNSRWIARHFSNGSFRLSQSRKTAGVQNHVVGNRRLLETASITTQIGRQYLPSGVEPVGDVRRLRKVHRDQALLPRVCILWPSRSGCRGSF